MKWTKLGLIFCPDNNYDWMLSHATYPVADQIAEHLYRIYFSSRDKENRSYIGYVDVDFENNFKVVDISTGPVLSPGEVGIFDDSGVGVNYLMNVDGKKYLYYLAWNLKVTVPWLNTIGLAIWNQEKNIFEKYSRAPLMDRSDEDPFTLAYPSILFENGIYRMWYGSNLRWGHSLTEMQHVIKYAESLDAINWKRSGIVHIGLSHVNEYTVSKPLVIKNENKYHMWYSYRGNGNIATYRIGYADSTDGFNWTRKDEEAGIDVSVNGWDSDMICYPFVFNYKEDLYMLYNGNGYGKTGFGIAKLIK